MNTGIIFVDKQFQKNLAHQRILDKNLIDYTIDNLKKAGSDKIIIISQNEYQHADAKWLNNVKELYSEISDSYGKLIITGVNYLNIDTDIYSSLYRNDSKACVVVNDGKALNIFALDSDLLKDYENLEYESFNISKDDLLEVNEVEDVVVASEKMRQDINMKHLHNGVSFIDINNTYIGEDVILSKGVVIYPDTYLEGHSQVGENTIITAGSHLINAIVGKNCKILSSRISDSILHDNISLGPYSHIRMGAEVMDNCRIGNFVEFKKTRFGRLSRSAHLTYLGDCEVGEDVNIGCGVITVNYDGAHKFKTTIKDRAFIGSNSNLIAPVTVGECSLVAAGSTITKDVEDGAMAIARQRQEIKPEFGFKYINKEK